MLIFFFFVTSDAEGRGNVLLLQIPHERPAMDLAADQILHHVQSMELEARIHRVHALRGQLCRRNEGIACGNGGLR